MNKYKLILLFILFQSLGCVNKKLYNKAIEKNNVLFNSIANGTANNLFPEKYFPKDQTIALMSQLKDNCDFSKRTQEFVESSFQKDFATGLSKIIISYKLFLKCDSMKITTSYLCDKDSLELYEFQLKSLR